ncbi:hypothetical protein ACFXAF_04715 [Kitasatospora sp. NPDC059463]|uniref:hypothetical protein n=1 Tax=unclassified Kitasatospora TaxID=2633591 RepID=UPI0036892B7C
MATSNGDGDGEGGGRLLRYLGSARNIAACGAGAVGLGLHFAGYGGAWWPGIVAALYGAVVLLWPPGAPKGTGIPGKSDPVSVREKPAPVQVPAPPVPVPVPEPPRVWPQLEELAVFVGSAPLPPSANVPGLLVRLRSAGPGPTTEPIVVRRLPLAVDGYLRALTWQPWVSDGADPAAELARAVDEMAALVPAS